MAEIARYSPDKGIYQKDIAEVQDISNKYLDHIIHSLKVAGLIGRITGRNSGYILTRDASEITMYDIHAALEPAICVVDCLGDVFDCSRKEFCDTVGFWRGLNDLVVDYFKSVSLEDIVKKEALKISKEI